MIIRKATASDLDRLRCLLHAYLIEMRLKGAEIQPTPRTLDFYSNLAQRYVRVDGTVLIAENDDGNCVGFTMAGNCSLPIDSDFGKSAMGWATYVMPAHRGHNTANELRRELRTELRNLGFDTVIGGVYQGDTAAMNSVQHTGWVPYLIHGYDDLHRGD